MILERLPEQERAEFLCQYHQAVQAASDPAGYNRLQQVRHEPGKGDLPGQAEQQGARPARRLPEAALSALVVTMADVTGYPDDRLRTFPTGDPHVRRAEFGDDGLVTYLIDDASATVTVVDVTWTG